MRRQAVRKLTEIDSLTAIGRAHDTVLKTFEAFAHGFVVMVQFNFR